MTYLLLPCVKKLTVQVHYIIGIKVVIRRLPCLIPFCSSLALRQGQETVQWQLIFVKWPH